MPFPCNTTVLAQHIKIHCCLVPCINIYKPGFLPLVLQKFELDNSWLLGCSVHYGIFTRIPVLYPLDSSSSPLGLSCNNQKCVHTLLNVP